MVSPRCQQNVDNSRCEDWRSGSPEKLNEQAHEILVLRPNRKISVLWVTGLKILGRVGTHIFIFFWRKTKIILCILKDISPFNMHKIIFFSRKPDIKSRFLQ